MATDYYLAELFLAELKSRLCLLFRLSLTFPWTSQYGLGPAPHPGPLQTLCGPLRWQCLPYPDSPEKPQQGLSFHVHACGASGVGRVACGAQRSALAAIPWVTGIF